MTMRELLLLVQAAVKAQSEWVILYQDNDNPQIVELYNLHHGKLNAYRAVLDALFGSKVEIQLDSLLPDNEVTNGND